MSRVKRTPGLTRSASGRRPCVGYQLLPLVSDGFALVRLLCSATLRLILGFRVASSVKAPSNPPPLLRPPYHEFLVHGVLDAQPGIGMAPTWILHTLACFRSHGSAEAFGS